MTGTSWRNTYMEVLATKVQQKRKRVSETPRVPLDQSIGPINQSIGSDQSMGAAVSSTQLDQTMNAAAFNLSNSYNTYSFFPQWHSPGCCTLPHNRKHFEKEALANKLYLKKHSHWSLFQGHEGNYWPISFNWCSYNWRGSGSHPFREPATAIVTALETGEEDIRLDFVQESLLELLSTRH